MSAGVDSGITLRAWLKEGEFALGMSSGFFGFFAHTGVLSVLEDEGLIPTRLAGSSAGALVTGAWAAGLDATEIQKVLFGLDRKDFWDPRPGLGFLRGRLFHDLLEETFPQHHFHQTRAPIHLSVFDVLGWKTVVMDEGHLISAVRASCSVPFMFHPVWIDKKPYLDGGVLDRPGISGLPDGTRVFYHHLASRSPWRRKKSPALQVPSRQNQAALVIEGLPRVAPHRLSQGPLAFEAARKAMQKALELPLLDGTVRVPAH
jgi:NTE family protein